MKRAELVAAATRVADIVLLLVGAVSASGLLEVLYYYAWTKQRHFSGSLYAVPYYGFPSALLALVFAAFRLSPAYRVNLVIVIVAVVGSVVPYELLMESKYASLYTSTIPVMQTLIESTDKSSQATLSRQWAVDIDARTGGEVIAALQRKGVDAVPILAANNGLFIEQADGSFRSAITVDGQEVIPLTGVSNRVTVLCNESGQWIHYRSDEHGFNNPPEIWRLDRPEIAALGDSYTLGYCVPIERTFVPLIRRRHPATLNLAMTGDGPLLMLATLKEYLPRLKPKIVLWFYYEGNDLTDLQRERRSTLMNYLGDGFTQSNLARQADIDRAMLAEIPRLIAQEEERLAQKRRNTVRNTLRDLSTLAALRQRLGLNGGLDADQRDRAADLEGPNMMALRRVLVEAKATVDTWGGRLKFVYLPEWARYTSNTSWGKSKRRDVLAIVRDMGIPLIDIDPAFQAHGDPLSLFPFRKAGHYNEEGHRVVADEVLKAIEEEQQGG